MSIYSLTSFFAAFLLYILAVFVYFNNKNRFLNKIYAIQCLVIGGWIFGCFGESVIKSYQFIVWWDKLLNVFAVFSPILFMHTHYAIIGQKASRVVKFLYGLSLVLLVISFSPFYIRGVEYRYGVRYISDPGPLYLVFIAYILYCLLYSMYKVWKTRQTAEHQHKMQLTYVLIASGSMATAAAIHLGMVLNIAISPLDNALNSIYGILMAYAIVRHRLLDIGVIIKKTIVFTGLLVSVLVMLILPTLLIQELILRSAILGGRIIGLVLSGVFIIVAVRRIETFLINVTDKYLFQKKYDYKKLLNTFTADVLTVLDLNDLIHLTKDNLINIMKITSCDLLLFGEDGPNNIIKFIETYPGYIFMNELREKKVKIPEAIHKKIHEINTDLIITIVLHDHIVGLLLLGKKKSDESYSEDDLDILIPLAKTLAIAISNAKLIDQIGRTQAEIAEKEKMAVIGTLAAGMAHEIRNPLTTIRVFAEYLPEKYKNNYFMKKFNKLIPREINKIDNLIYSLLEFSHIEEGAKNEQIDLINIMKIVLSVLEPNYKFSDINIIWNIKDRAFVSVHKKQIQEAFFNIMKYEFSESPKNSDIIIDTEKTNNNLLATIINKKLVVSDYILQNVFEPLSELYRARRGFGLDLLIAKHLIEQNGGNFGIISDTDRGTEIQISFKSIS